ncbi:MAG: hypothetical protein ACMUIG_03120 [Thermoplasmatota archaeon]
MVLRVFRIFLRWLSNKIPSIIDWKLTRFFFRGFIRQLEGEAADKFLELLLKKMSLAFCLDQGYRNNISNFSGKIAITAGEEAEASAVFDGGDMDVSKKDLKDADVRIKFKTVNAFRDLLTSGNQDILQFIIRDEVAIEGNPTYLYRFAFLSRELLHRLGVKLEG